MATPLGQKQSVKTLKLVVYNRPLHPELFDIHCRHQVDQAAFDAEVWITGCTHLVRFSVGEHTVTEVIAEADAELPERGLLASFRCRGEKQHQHRHDAGTQYLMNLQVEHMSEKLYAETHRDLTGSTKQGLFVPFPQWRVGELTPFCYVDHHVTPKTLHVFAYHAFPDELTIVKTQSIFEAP